MMPPRLLRVRDVAQRLDVSPRTVRHWLLVGKLAGVRQPGGQWRVAADVVDTFTPPTAPDDRERPS